LAADPSAAGDTLASLYLDGPAELRDPVRAVALARGDETIAGAADSMTTERLVEVERRVASWPPGSWRPDPHPANPRLVPGNVPRISTPVLTPESKTKPRDPDAAVGTWRDRPARSNGEPVGAQTELMVEFTSR